MCLHTDGNTPPFQNENAACKCQIVLFHGSSAHRERCLLLAHLVCVNVKEGVQKNITQCWKSSCLLPGSIFCYIPPTKLQRLLHAQAYCEPCRLHMHFLHTVGISLSSVPIACSYRDRVYSFISHNPSGYSQVW